MTLSLSTGMAASNMSKIVNLTAVSYSYQRAFSAAETHYTLRCLRKRNQVLPLLNQLPLSTVQLRNLNLHNVCCCHSFVNSTVNWISEYGRLNFDVIKFMITCAATAEIHYSIYIIAMTTTSLQTCKYQGIVHRKDPGYDDMFYLIVMSKKPRAVLAKKKVLISVVPRLSVGAWVRG